MTKDKTAPQETDADTPSTPLQITHRDASIHELPTRIIEACLADFPQEAIAKIGDGRNLSSIKAYYVTERLNNVFGIGRWTVQHKVVRENDHGVVVKGRIVLIDYNIKTPVTYGGDTVRKAQDWEDAHKSAVTALISKSASFLGIGASVFKGQQTHETAEKPRTNGNGSGKRNGNGQRKNLIHGQLYRPESVTFYKDNNDPAERMFIFDVGERWSRIIAPAMMIPARVTLPDGIGETLDVDNILIKVRRDGRYFYADEFVIQDPPDPETQKRDAALRTEYITRVAQSNEPEQVKQNWLAIISNQPPSNWRDPIDKLFAQKVHENIGELKKDMPE